MFFGDGDPEEVDDLAQAGLVESVASDEPADADGGGEEVGEDDEVEAEPE
ncbi:hypothetical protein [Mucisphaera calidilacus]|nr:hypothetical protein [Mucisphaera calidilacus]